MSGPHHIIVEQLRCGECGGRAFAVTHERPGDKPRAGGGGQDDAGGTVVDGKLHIVCNQCGDRTELQASPARLAFHGNLCGGWS